MTFKHLTVLVVAMTYVFVETQAAGIMPIEPYANEEVDPDKIDGIDVGVVPLEGDGKASDDVDDIDTDALNSVMPESGYARISISEEVQPGGYKYHLEQLLLQPEVKHYVAGMKAKYHSYVNKIKKNMQIVKEIEENDSKYKDEMYESVAAAEIQFDFHHCLKQRIGFGASGMDAYKCCGNKLWMNAKQKLALMEASLPENQMNRK